MPAVAFRLIKKKWTESAFSGEGARRYGGRWNSPGTAMVYAGESLALAQLEVLAGLPIDRLLGSYVAFRVQIPEGCVEAYPLEELPSSWRADPTPQTARRIGDLWIREGRSLALEVPSAVVPRERCYLINPHHEDFECLDIEGPFDPEIDERIS